MAASPIVQRTLEEIRHLADFGLGLKLSDGGEGGEETDEELEQYFITALGDIADMLIVEDGKIVDFDTFIKLPFVQAKDQTERMSAKQRIEYLERLDERCLSLYEKTKLFSAGEGIPRDMQLTHKEFMGILSKIKHCEILQNWLYGIY